MMESIKEIKQVFWLNLYQFFKKFKIPKIKKKQKILHLLQECLIAMQKVKLYLTCVKNKEMGLNIA